VHIHFLCKTFNAGNSVLADMQFTDHPRSGVLYNFCRVCLYVSQMIAFKSLDVGSSYMHVRSISREYRSSSYIKVIGSSLRSVCFLSVLCVVLF